MSRMYFKTLQCCSLFMALWLVKEEKKRVDFLLSTRCVLFMGKLRQNINLNDMIQGYSLKKSFESKKKAIKI